MNARKRLPNRRPAHTEALEIDGQAFTATVGFDPEDNSPRELFLTAGREGSMLNSLLADAAVVVSVALQHGVPVAALAKSVGRAPDLSTMPGSLDQLAAGSQPASPIGAALDLLIAHEPRPDSEPSDG